LSSHAYMNRWSRNAWAPPATLSLVAIYVLCRAAWAYGYNDDWLAHSHAWWGPLLKPNQDGTLLVTIALLLATLVAFWLPRRRERVPIAPTTVVALVLITAALGTASYVPCRGTMSTTGVTFWILQMYVGQPPNIYQNVGPMPPPVLNCTGAPPLALQLGQIAGLAATLIGAIAATSALWRRPFEELRSRFASDVTIVTGLTDLTYPLLSLIIALAPRPRSVVVIEPDENNTFLDDVRATGARVVVGQPESPFVLQPIIRSWRGCALNHLYALAPRPADNEAVIETARDILSHCKPHPHRQPHLVTLIGDPRHANSWRGKRGGRSAVWFEDALNQAETTAYDLVSRVLQLQPRHLLICGESKLTGPILVEFTRRAWEQEELARAVDVGRATAPGLMPAAIPARWPVPTVTLLAPRANDIKREYHRSTPPALLGSLPDIDAQKVQWRDELLNRLDRMERSDRAKLLETVVIVADDPPGSASNVAGRIARLHPGTTLFVLSESDDADGEALFDGLHEFSYSLLVTDEVPQDTWTRIARHWHEYYRLSYPVPIGDSRMDTRRPWEQVHRFTRQDNILQLRSVLTEMVNHGRQWTPTSMIPPGSIVEPGDIELTEVAMAEHERWFNRQVANGRTGVNVVPWEQLPPERQRSAVTHLRWQLSQLEAVGFVPMIPPGGPAAARQFERIGVVRASRLIQPLTWTNYTGEEMQGRPGDWRIIDAAGNLRTATDSDFRTSHTRTDDGAWRRTGVFTAWQVDQAVVVRTKEGNATARPNDWIVESPSAERWPVSADQFEQTYRAADRPGTSEGAGAASAIPAQRAASPVWRQPSA
jgi:hypothetical protein